MFEVTDKYKNNPVTKYLNGKRIAIGGDVVLQRTPPKAGELVKECTQSEYKQLYDEGYTFFFKELVAITTKKGKKENELQPKPTDEGSDSNAILSDSLDTE